MHDVFGVIHIGLNPQGSTYLKYQFLLKLPPRPPPLATPLIPPTNTFTNKMHSSLSRCPRSFFSRTRCGNCRPIYSYHSYG